MFTLGRGYSRAEIRTLVGDPKTKGGAWDTGYREWNGEFFIFAGVGVKGRTGHDYDNHWEGQDLAWQAKNGTRLDQEEIGKLLGGEYPIHLFTRSNELLPWVYRGLARPISVTDTTPVGVVWRFDADPAITSVSPGAAPAAGTEATDPRTETEALRAARLGQTKFRNQLMDRWDRRCAATGLPLPELLRASHIKPWRDSSAQERLDPDNGLLLAVHVDGLFDRGLISFDDEGAIVRSPMLSEDLIRALGLDQLPAIKGLSEGSRAYLAQHREHYLKRDQPA
jgi:hypothetical protein